MMKNDGDAIEYVADALSMDRARPYRSEVDWLMNDLYDRMDFIISGGALKLLTDYLGSKGASALIVEPDRGGFRVLDAIGVAPGSLMLKEEGLDIRSMFSQHPPASPFEIDEAQGDVAWPCVVRIRGGHWEIYILLKETPPASLASELHPYAGMIRLWRTFQAIDENEEKLSRLSYMILATKNTLASIFEPMPLRYFASFLADVLRESLFPKSVAVLKDEGGYLTVLNGEIASVPERVGPYAEHILPPAPIVIGGDEPPFKIVLPVVGEKHRLFCLLTWDRLPDEQVMNFMELLGNLAVRAIAINDLQEQTQKAATHISTSEFTILSISNVLKILKSTWDRDRFLATLTDILMEQGRMSDCVLAIWDGQRQGYALADSRIGQLKKSIDPTLLPAPRPVSAQQITEPSFDLMEMSADSLFKSWGLGGCPWEDMDAMRYLFPICDDASLVGAVALAARDGQTPPTKGQLAALHLITQFAAYEFRRL